MVQIREIKKEKQVIDAVVTIHLEAFQGFFLTFMGRGFLRHMYYSYCEHIDSGLLVACDDSENLLGFLAYSKDMSGLYKYMLKKRLYFYAIYSLGAFFRKPKAFIRIIRAFLKPVESKRNEKYVVLASIGVSPIAKSKGIGTQLITVLKQQVDFTKYDYITLETDAIENDRTNMFYQRNGFMLVRTFKTHEGRMMNEYHYRG